MVRPCGGQVHQAGQEVPAGEQVEPAGRLVQDQHLRVGGQGQGQGHAGVPALGQVAEPLPRVEPELVRPARGTGRGTRPGGRPAGEPADLGDGHPLVEPGPLRHVPDPVRAAGRPGPSSPGRGCGPAPVRRVHPDQHLDGGRLARPVVAQEGVHGPLGDLQVEPVHHGLAAVPLDQPADGNDPAHARSSRPRRRARPLSRAHSSPTSAATSSAVSPLAAASRTASRTRSRTISRRRAAHRAGAFARDLHAAPPLALQHAHPLQVLIGPGHGVRVDEQPLGQVADAGHQVPGRGVPGGHPEHHLGGDLLVDGDRRVRPDGEGHGRADTVY